MKRIIKANNLLIFSGLILAGLHYGASLLIPITFAIFFASLIFPVVDHLERKLGAGRLTSSFVGTFFVFIGIGLLSFFLLNELGRFLGDIIQRRDEIISYFQTLQHNIAASTNFSMEQQEELLRNSLVEIINVTQDFITRILSNVMGLLLDFLITLVFVFLLLVNRDKMANFIMMYTSREKQPRVKNIIEETSKVAQKYLLGRLKVMSGLAIMYLLAFIAYDVPHMWLLVIFGALVTIIPFIGPFLSGILPILFMIGFGGSFMEILTFALLISVIQLIESYVLEPLIIGSDLQQSPLFVIIAVLLGGIVWGPAGFILFVPLFAIIKIIFDHIEELEPVGFLIGYERPGSGEGRIKRIKKKFRK